MKLGQKAMEALRAEITGELKAGDDLVVAGDIALSGTCLLYTSSGTDEHLESALRDRSERTGSCK